MTAEGFEDYAYHIFTEGTQFVQWNSPMKTNSWICQKNKTACFIDRSPKIFVQLKWRIHLKIRFFLKSFHIFNFANQYPWVWPFNKITFKGQTRIYLDRSRLQQKYKRILSEVSLTLTIISITERFFNWAFLIKELSQR